jgi:hypothetical protein
MRKLILATIILAIAGVAPCFARGGHGHGHHQIHGHSRHASSAPADPSAPSSQTSDAGVTGSAPMPSNRQLQKTDAPAPQKLDPEDAKLDQRIKSICRGC